MYFSVSARNQQRILYMTTANEVLACSDGVKVTYREMELQCYHKITV
jgi:hypothetical protein